MSSVRLLDGTGWDQNGSRGLPRSHCQPAPLQATCSAKLVALPSGFEQIFLLSLKSSRRNFEKTAYCTNVGFP